MRGHDGDDNDVSRRLPDFRAEATHALGQLELELSFGPKFSLRHIVIRLSRNLRVRDL